MSQVSKRDRQRLRLTCKHLGDILEAQVLQNIYFNIQKHNYSQATERLQSLANTENKNLSRGLSRSGRHLHIGSLSPKPFGSLKSYTCVGDELVPVPEPEDGPEVAVVEEMMRTYLRGALDALRSLQSVTWIPEEKDEAWTHEIIMDFLTSRPSLHTLTVELSHLRVALPLDRMQDLREIDFTERYGYRSSEPVRVHTYKNLAKFLASNPAGQITKLSVVLTSLHEVFQFLTPKAEPLRFNELQMTQSFIKLDPFTLPHLRHLTCLHLLSMKVPSMTEDPDSGSSGDLENAERRAGSKLTDVWSALQRAGIHLREIVVDRVNAGLLGYLTHYTGLTKLVISTNGFDTSPESDAVARLFFAEPLASHNETLQEFEVYAGFEDLWCFCEHNISAFSSCTGLRKLGVSVVKADLPARVSGGVPEAEIAPNQPNIVKTLLDKVSTHMPRLSQLWISPASEERFRGGRRQGTRTYMHRKAVAQLAIECLLAYPIPPNVQLPNVSIWTKTFEPHVASTLLDEIVGGGPRRRYREIIKEVDVEE
ncbi:hypothetical protein M413DRAFT_9232 [Hebeloma cylindrosporum]|uniref:Uncharacterized protein n=1 Tax=Hebeloma cylindrosporum TaxID=76867 RepID=A0A0C2YSB1_HEBCY|nr:hypothetical protein M413DRAFT_9232 [Hebeloma cylindrosporum h7]